MALHALQADYILGEYRIEKLLGEGGFGLTYLAFDTHLEKQVAIKEYMPSEHALRESDSKIIAKSAAAEIVYKWGLKAFLNEAKTLAKFEDPNIVRIHRFFKANGTAYIVMEYCEGKCLVDRITKDKPMGEEEVKLIISAITCGLQLVHNAGILHRDIKPDNIMFRLDGSPVLIDFGAARQAIGEKNRKITTIVTPGYAPLEQYSSKGSIGPWSDIYSLSAVAYLCLIGKRPPNIMNRLHDDTIINLNNELGPSDFLKSVDLGLEIQVNNRPKNLLEWSQSWCDLSHINIDERFSRQHVNSRAIFPGNSSNTKTIFNTASVKPATKKNTIIAILVIMLLTAIGFYTYNSDFKAQEPVNLKNTKKSPHLIAVLPLVNTKPDIDTDFLGFALADQIIGQLLYFKQLTVRPSSSIRQYDKTNIDPVKIANDLKVDYILSGNYLKLADLIRLNFELIEVKSNQLIWRESLDFSYDTVFELQDKVATKLSQKLGLELTLDEFKHSHESIASNPIAYEYYLRSLSYPLTKEGDQLAIAMLENSIELEPDYTASHVELGRRLNRLAIYGLGEEEDFQLAKKHLLMALSLNKDSLAALRNLATFYTETGEILKALDMAQRMLKINPNHADAYFSIAYIYRYAGMLTESVEMIEKALSIDPKNMKYSTLGVNYYNMGNYQKALDTFDLIKDIPFGLMWQGFVHHKLGNNDKAIMNLDRLIGMQAGDFYKYIAIANIAIISGDKQQGIEALKQLEQSNVNDAEALYYWASYYAELGEKTASINLLNKAVEYGYFNLPFMQTDVFFDSLRDDEEFMQIIALAKQKHLAFKKAVSEYPSN